MNYQEKIRFAEQAALELDGQKSTEEIKAGLKEQGLYEYDITNVLASARNILGEKYQAKIKTYLLEDKPIHDSEEFSTLDKASLESLIEKETLAIALEEQNKIKKLVKAGQAPEQILTQINLKFLPLEKAVQQIAKHQEIKQETSGSGRLLNIAGGIGLIVLTGVVLVATGRLFIFLPIIGLVMIVKGLLAVGE